ncbi:hypothetical protein ACFL43_04905 [Thermodesulfobacteriota bacterium]
MRKAVLAIGIGLCLACCGDVPRPAVPPLPPRLDTLQLVKSDCDSRANKLLYRMHGRLTGTRSSCIGYYDGPPRRNVLYLSAFKNNRGAAEALHIMAAKMATSAAGFSPPAAVPADSAQIYRTQGGGLTHFFYRSGNLVIWWQAEPRRAQPTIRALQARFRPARAGAGPSEAR